MDNSGGATRAVTWHDSEIKPNTRHLFFTQFHLAFFVKCAGVCLLCTIFQLVILWAFAKSNQQNHIIQTGKYYEFKIQ